MDKVHMHMLQGSDTTFVCGLTGRAQHEVANSPVQIPAAGVWCCMNVCMALDGSAHINQRLGNERYGII